MKKVVMALMLGGLILAAGCGRENTLQVSGTIEAKEVVVSAETGGTVKELQAVEGAAVKVGDVLARLDDTALRYQLEQAKAAWTAADAQRRGVGAGSRVEQVRSAKANLDQVQALANGAQVQINDLTGALSDIGGKIRDTQTSLDAIQDPTLKLQAQTQLANLQSAQTDLQIRLDNAKSQLAVYQAQLRTAQAQYDLVLAGATSQAKEAAAAQADQAAALVKVSETQLAKAEVKSPLDGVIETVGVERGELAGPGMPLVTIIDPLDLSLTVYVPENELSRVQVGHEVKISVDSYPGESFSGKVLRINTQAEFTPKNVQTPSERVNMVFGVKIQVTGGQDRLRPGMPADVSL